MLDLTLALYRILLLSRAAAIPYGILYELNIYSYICFKTGALIAVVVISLHNNNSKHFVHINSFCWAAAIASFRFFTTMWQYIQNALPDTLFIFLLKFVLFCSPFSFHNKKKKMEIKHSTTNKKIKENKGKREKNILFCCFSVVVCIMILLYSFACLFILVLFLFVRLCSPLFYMYRLNYIVYYSYTLYT